MKLKFKYILSEEEFNLLNRILEEKIEDGGDVEIMTELVKFYEHINNDWLEINENKKQLKDKK